MSEVCIHIVLLFSMKDNILWKFFIIFWLFHCCWSCRPKLILLFGAIPPAVTLLELDVWKFAAENGTAEPKLICPGPVVAPKIPILGGKMSEDVDMKFVEDVVPII